MSDARWLLEFVHGAVVLEWSRFEAIAQDVGVPLNGYASIVDVDGRATYAVAVRDEADESAWQMLLDRVVAHSEGHDAFPQPRGKRWEATTAIDSELIANWHANPPDPDFLATH